MAELCQRFLLTTTWLKIPQVPRDTSMGHLNSNADHRRSIEQARVSKSNCACRFDGASRIRMVYLNGECLLVADVFYRFCDRLSCRSCFRFFVSQVQPLADQIHFATDSKQDRNNTLYYFCYQTLRRWTSLRMFLLSKLKFCVRNILADPRRFSGYYSFEPWRFNYYHSCRLSQ